MASNAVSYTHLDVYKRQVQCLACSLGALLVLGGEIRRVDQLQAGRDIEAAGATDQQQAPDSGLPARSDNGATASDELLANVGHTPAGVEGAEDRSVTPQLFGQRRAVVHLSLIHI